MSEDYDREKLANAVRVLATSPEPIQKRLEYAWIAFHTLRNIGMENADRKAEYNAIYDRLTTDPKSSDPRLNSAVCAALTDEEARDIAEAIVNLNSALIHDRIYALEDELKAIQQA